MLSSEGTGLHDLTPTQLPHIADSRLIGAGALVGTKPLPYRRA